MHFAWSYFFVLIWLAYLIASGVLLFSRGFLLSRVSKTDVNTCRRLSLDPNDQNYLTEEIVQEIFKDVNATIPHLCLPQKSKVIIMVIDALKYEFGIYKENETNPLPYENKLPIFHKLLKEQPNNSRIVRFKADPPTTTLQRLKGLTTGSLPTFIDIGSNFATPEINEDNIIDQMIRNKLPVVFMGDGTWTDLYPRRFKREYSYPSFDIFDLDTVDNNIKEHLPREMKTADWQVLIAHFLGVDHCGHKYGPMHSEMARKLNEMNDVIGSVIAQMDNDTTLLIMGDHGMTASGDHGGETDDETNALLFAYSKQHKFVNSYFSLDNQTMQQIDLVPTLSTILGIPIPYSNLGLINFNLIPEVSLPYMRDFQVLQLHAWQNARQMYQYFYKYATENKRTFNVDDMSDMETEYILLAHRVKSIYNELALTTFMRDLQTQLRNVLNTCRELWIRFDPTQMSHGLLITMLPIFFAFLLINNCQANDFYTIFPAKEVGYTYLLNLAAGVFGYRYYRNFSFKTEEQGVIFFTNIVSTLILIYYTAQNWSKIATNWSSVKRFANVPTRLILIITMCVFFSNSFIIEEGLVLSFLLSCSIILLVYEILQRNVRADFKIRFKWSQFLRSTAFKLILASALALTCIRAANLLFRCREEQGNCADFSKNNTGFSLKAAGDPMTNLLALVMIVLYVTMTRIYLRSCGNLTGNNPNVFLARYGPTLASICLGGHIFLANSNMKNIQRSYVDAMAIMIYTLMLVQIIIFSASPLMTYVLPPKSRLANAAAVAQSEGHSIVPEIFRRIKRMYEGDQAERRYEIPVVYGLATIYSSIVIAFGTFLTLVLIVLLEPKSTIGIIICIVVGAIVLSVNAILRFRTAINFETCIQPSFTTVVSWFLLAHFCFFATSHQTTLSQIDWRAAFVGRTSSLGQSHFISGILVILNTFCGQILFFCMYGLLCTETFSIFALLPNLIRSNYNRENRRVEPNNARARLSSTATQPTLADLSNESIGFDMTRGELILFENEATFLGTAFKVATQFFMLQGLKVFCAMMACTIHCRHLMVWKIFAPRFIYESLATFVTFPALIIGYLILMRIHLSVNGLIGRINKIK